MSRRLRPSFPPLAGATLLCVMATGLAHLSGRADAGSAASARRGGTLRLSGVLIPSVDPAIAYLPGAWQILVATGKWLLSPSRYRLYAQGACGTDPRLTAVRAITPPVDR